MKQEKHTTKHEPPQTEGTDRQVCIIHDCDEDAEGSGKVCLIAFGIPESDIDKELIKKIRAEHPCLAPNCSPRIELHWWVAGRCVFSTVDNRGQDVIQRVGPLIRYEFTRKCVEVF